MGSSKVKTSHQVEKKNKNSKFVNDVKEPLKKILKKNSSYIFKEEDMQVWSLDKSSFFIQDFFVMSSPKAKGSYNEQNIKFRISSSKVENEFLESFLQNSLLKEKQSLLRHDVEAFHENFSKAKELFFKFMVNNSKNCELLQDGQGGGGNINQKINEIVQNENILRKNFNHSYMEGRKTKKIVDSRDENQILNNKKIQSFFEPYSSVGGQQKLPLGKDYFAKCKKMPSATFEKETIEDFLKQKSKNRKLFREFIMVRRNQSCIEMQFKRECLFEVIPESEKRKAKSRTDKLLKQNTTLTEEASSATKKVGPYLKSRKKFKAKVFREEKKKCNEFTLKLSKQSVMKSLFSRESFIVISDDMSVDSFVTDGVTSSQNCSEKESKDRNLKNTKKECDLEHYHQRDSKANSANRKKSNMKANKDGAYEKLEDLFKKYLSNEASCFDEGLHQQYSHEKTPLNKNQAEKNFISQLSKLFSTLKNPAEREKVAQIIIPILAMGKQSLEKTETLENLSRNFSKIFGKAKAKNPFSSKFNISKSPPRTKGGHSETESPSGISKEKSSPRETKRRKNYHQNLDSNKDTSPIRGHGLRNCSVKTPFVKDNLTQNKRHQEEVLNGMLASFFTPFNANETAEGLEALNITIEDANKSSAENKSKLYHVSPLINKSKNLNDKTPVGLGKGIADHEKSNSGKEEFYGKNQSKNIGFLTDVNRKRLASDINKNCSLNNSNNRGLERKQLFNGQEQKERKEQSQLSKNNQDQLHLKAGIAKKELEVRIREMFEAAEPIPGYENSQKTWNSVLSLGQITKDPKCKNQKITEIAPEQLKSSAVTDKTAPDLLSLKNKIAAWEAKTEWNGLKSNHEKDFQLFQKIKKYDISYEDRPEIQHEIPKSCSLNITNKIIIGNNDPIAKITKESNLKNSISIPQSHILSEKEQNCPVDKNPLQADLKNRSYIPEKPYISHEEDQMPVDFKIPLEFHSKSTIYDPKCNLPFGKNQILGSHKNPESSQGSGNVNYDESLNQEPDSTTNNLPKISSSNEVTIKDAWFFEPIQDFTQFSNPKRQYKKRSMIIGGRSEPLSKKMVKSNKKYVFKALKLLGRKEFPNEDTLEVSIRTYVELLIKKYISNKGKAHKGANVKNSTEAMKLFYKKLHISRGVQANLNHFIDGFPNFRGKSGATAYYNNMIIEEIYDDEPDHQINFEISSNIASRNKFLSSFDHEDTSGFIIEEVQQYTNQIIECDIFNSQSYQAILFLIKIFGLQFSTSRMIENSTESIKDDEQSSLPWLLSQEDKVATKHNGLTKLVSNGLINIFSNGMMSSYNGLSDIFHNFTSFNISAIEILWFNRKPLILFKVEQKESEFWCTSNFVNNYISNLFAGSVFSSTTTSSQRQFLLRTIKNIFGQTGIFTSYRPNHLLGTFHVRQNSMHFPQNPQDFFKSFDFGLTEPIWENTYPNLHPKSNENSLCIWTPALTEVTFD